MKFLVFFFLILILIIFSGCPSNPVITTYTLSISTSGSGLVTKSPDNSSYNSGTQVILTAVPSENWEFINWSGGLTGSSNPATVTMNSNKSINAVFEEVPPEEFQIIVNVLGEGMVIKNPDKTSYEEGEIVEITAVPSQGWEFESWLSGVEFNINPAEIEVEGTTYVTARFTELYEFNLTKEGNGSVFKDPDKEEYSEGEQVIITAEASPGWDFMQWENDYAGPLNPATVTMDSDKNIHGVFVPSAEEYTLTLGVTGEGTVAAAPEKNLYFYNEDVELAAIPDNGWQFSHWLGDVENQFNPTTIYTDENKVATAVFIEKVYTLNITAEGSGTVTKNPNKEEYIEGEIVQITANPETDWSFWGWERDLNTDENPVNVTMDENKNIHAVFLNETVPKHTLTVVPVGNGNVTITPEKAEYDTGEEVEIEAFPDPGWIFVRWEDDYSGSDNPATIVMGYSKNIFAVFERESFPLTINIVGEGEVQKNPDKETYTDGEVVQLTAVPAENYEFERWEGDLTGSSNPEEIIINEQKEVTAYFEEQPIIFDDIKFKNAVKDYLGITTDEIYPSDVENVEELDASYYDVASIKGIEYFINLQRFTIRFANIPDISPLENLTNLEVLFMYNCGIENIEPLEQLTNIFSLQLYGNNINDLTPLENLNKLKFLYLAENQIDNIDSLENLINIESLNLDCNQITDVEALREMTKLTTLGMRRNQIINISPLENLTNLVVLNLSHNHIENIEALENMTKLEILSLFENCLSDINPLYGLINLTYLDLRMNEIIDIDSLENMTDLNYLYLSDNGIENISSLEYLTELKFLFADNNLINEIDSLYNLTNLTGLYLSNNQIGDIDALENLYKLTHLDLSKNNIENIQSVDTLTSLEILGLQQNIIADLSPLENNDTIRFLDLSSNQIDNIDALESLSNINALYIINNLVDDIEALVNNTELADDDYLYIRNNYLDLTPGSKDMNDIQTLMNRGVFVEYEPQY